MPPQRMPSCGSPHLQTSEDDGTTQRVICWSLHMGGPIGKEAVFHRLLHHVFIPSLDIFQYSSETSFATFMSVDSSIFFFILDLLSSHRQAPDLTKLGELAFLLLCECKWVAFLSQRVQGQKSENSAHSQAGEGKSSDLAPWIWDICVAKNSRSKKQE